jgi:hypothetical protein
MKLLLVPMVLFSSLLLGCDGGGGSSKQGPQSQANDSARTSAQGCEALTGTAREDCTRQTREGGTATPSVPTNAGEKPTPTTGSAASAQAERGSGTSATNSAGVTTGSQGGSVGSTGR